MKNVTKTDSCDCNMCVMILRKVAAVCNYAKRHLFTSLHPMIVVKRCNKSVVRSFAKVCSIAK